MLENIEKSWLYQIRLISIREQYRSNLDSQNIANFINSHSQQLQRLEIQCWEEKLSKIAVQQISNYLETQQKSLKILRISLGPFYNQETGEEYYDKEKSLNDDDLEQLYICVGKLDLYQLDLKITGFSHISGNTIHALQKSISLNKNLTKLRINFSGGKNIQDSFIGDLFESFKSLEKLKYLKINIHETTLVNEKTAIKFLESSIYLKKLEKFHIYLGLTNTGEQALLSYAKGIGNLKNLKKIKFDIFENTNITNAGMQHIISGNHIQNLDSLTSVHIKIAETSQINKDSLVYFPHFLQSNSQNLEQLIIEFPYTRMCSDSLKYIAQGIENCLLNKLKTLILDFSGNDQITSKGSISLFNSIQNCKHLQKLNINLQYCKNVDHNIIPPLNNSITNLRNLYSIKIQLPTQQDEQFILKVFQNIWEELTQYNKIKQNIIIAEQKKLANHLQNIRQLWDLSIEE